MSYLDKYIALSNAYGATVRDAQINATKQKIRDTFVDSPSYGQVTINASSIPVGMQVVDNSDQKEEKLGLALSDTVYTVGDYVNWKSSVWLTIMLDDMEGIYKRGVMRRCFSSLKWLNEDGLVREAYFTYKTDTTRGAGVVDGNIMTLPEERRYIFIQSNADTQKLKKEQRFIFDQRAWRTTSIDHLQPTGLVSLELKEDLLGANDNLDLRIADYAGNAANFTLTILEGDTLSVSKGSTAQLTVEVRNNGTIVTKDVIFSSSNETIATVSSTGLVSGVADGNCSITAKLAMDLTVQDSISITVATVVQDHWTLSVAETPDVIKGYSQVFTAVVKNNGQVVNGRQIQWSIWADDEVSTTNKAVITSYTDTQCTLRGDNLGYVKLKMVLVDPVINVSTFIRISISSLL